MYLLYCLHVRVCLYTDRPTSSMLLTDCTSCLLLDRVTSLNFFLFGSDFQNLHERFLINSCISFIGSFIYCSIIICNMVTATPQFICMCFWSMHYVHWTLMCVLSSGWSVSWSDHGLPSSAPALLSQTLLWTLQTSQPRPLSGWPGGGSVCIHLVAL